MKSSAHSFTRTGSYTGLPSSQNRSFQFEGLHDSLEVFRKSPRLVCLGSVGLTAAGVPTNIITDLQFVQMIHQISLIKIIDKNERIQYKARQGVAGPSRSRRTHNRSVTSRQGGQHVGSRDFPSPLQISECHRMNGAT